MFSLKSKFRKLLPAEKNGKAYILPTLYGIGFLFLIVNIFALGYYRDNAPYHTVGLTLIVFGLVAMIHSNTNIQNVRIAVEKCEPSAAGDLSEISFILHSEGGAPSHNLTVGLDPELDFKSAFVGETLTEVRSTLTVRCRARGLYPLGRIKVVSRGVYGMFQAWRWEATDEVLVVYPKPQGSLPLPSGGGDKAKRLEGERADRTGSGEDFQGHRPYVLGDSLQQVDWKAYARGQDLLMKEYASDGSEALDLDWDDTQGPTEVRLEQLSAWIAQMNRAQRSYGLKLPHFELPRGSGSRHDEAAYYALAAFKET